MKGIALCQQFNNVSLDIFSIFSKRDNVLMFCIAKDGLKTHSTELHDEIPTKKRYYKALKKLKDANLIEKFIGSRDIYFHTNYGSVIYQKLFVELIEIANNKDKFKMIDTLKQPNKFLENDIHKFVESVIGTKIQNNDDNSLSFNSEIIWSFEKLILSIIEKVKHCKTELLIATRLYSEEVVNEILLKSKVGVHVKILADTKLIQGYFKSQNNCGESNDNKNNKDIKRDDNCENERLTVIGDPWYPNKEGIQRKVMDIPFGLLVVDGKEVGIEIINRNDTQNFFVGLFISDEKLASNFKEWYMKLWDDASDDISLSIPIN